MRVALTQIILYNIPTARVSYSGYYATLPRLRWGFDSPYPLQRKTLLERGVFFCLRFLLHNQRRFHVWVRTAVVGVGASGESGGVQGVGAFLREQATVECAIIIDCAVGDAVFVRERHFVSFVDGQRGCTEGVVLNVDGEGLIYFDASIRVYDHTAIRVEVDVDAWVDHDDGDDLERSSDVSIMGIFCNRISSLAKCTVTVVEV